MLTGHALHWYLHRHTLLRSELDLRAHDGEERIICTVDAPEDQQHQLPSLSRIATSIKPYGAALHRRA